MLDLNAHVDSHKTLGHAWPPSAQFALLNRQSTWPIGWSATQGLEFFDTKEQLDAKVASLHEWAKLEDNYVAYRVYEWDWGPQVRDEYNEGNLRSDPDSVVRLVA